MRMLGQGAGAAGDWVFRRLLSVNAVYDAFHFSQLRDNGRLARVLDRMAVDWMFPHLRETMGRFRPELVVSVFATGAGAVTRLKAEGYDVTSVVAMTDSFAHRFWVHESTDLFLVTSAAAGESVRRYWPEAQVEIITAPVRPEFYSRPVAARPPGISSGFRRRPPACWSCPGRGGSARSTEPPPSWPPTGHGCWRWRGRTRRWRRSSGSWPGGCPG